MKRTAQPVGLMVHFQSLPDPRVERTRHHELPEILTIALCAVISGADGWVHVEQWGEAKEAWLRTFLALPHGIPSHDTFDRVFSKLNPDAFRKCFMEWVGSVAEALKEHVVIDGKTLRRSFDRAAGRGAIHMVSAWAREAHLALGQVKTDEKSNEITAIPRLLDLLELEGCIVTIDAMGCQKEIATRIVEKGADYVLALKANQPATLEQVSGLFERAETNNWADVVHGRWTTEEKGHGRFERREYFVVPAFAHVELSQWPRLGSLLMVKRHRDDGVNPSSETHFFLSSLPPVAEKHATLVRGHWSIENELHWCLDVQFNQDQSRIRKDHGPENLTILQHMALNLLKQEKTKKLGVKSKRLVAAWDEAYLLKIIRG